jgi:singapore isolate B (sub-type 7) whole genome shotgun sequence assembly, scaffold_2
MSKQTNLIPSLNMAYIDRTEEFKLATNAQAQLVPSSGNATSSPNFSVSKFSKVTASLSNRVSKTTLKLQRLTDRGFPELA